MKITHFFDARTWTLTYVVWDEVSRDALIIDPVLDYDPVAVRVFEDSIQQVLAYLTAEGLQLKAILETHAHADHMSGAWRLREATGAPILIGEKIQQVQDLFAGVFGMQAEMKSEKPFFDRLLADGERIQLGTFTLHAIATPGHTPACMSYQVGDAVFTGDALFMPDFGTGRCDFPNGSAADLWDSIQKIYALPDETRVFVGHDYQPNGRPLAFQTTVGESKAKNIQLKGATAREDYVQFRTQRDKTLKLPALIFQSLQVNIRAGKLPEPEANGKRYLKSPLNLFD